MSSGSSVPTTLQISPATGFAAYATSINVHLSDNDLNALKLIPALMSAVYLAIDAASVYDMNGNALVAVPLTAARAGINFVRDTTSPNPVSWDFNLNAQTITLRFDEVVNVTSVNIARLTVFDLSNTVRLNLAAPGTLVAPVVNGLSLSFQLDVNDINQLKLQGVSDYQTSLALQLNSAALTDMSGNPSNAAILNCSLFSPDITSPVLLRSEVNLNLSMLTMVFNEPINVTSFQPSSLILKSSSSGGGVTLRMTNSTTAANSQNGLQIIIVFSEGELNEIKLRPPLFSSNTTAYVGLDAQFAKDLAGNSVQVVTAGFVNFIAADSARPTLLYFDLNMNSGQVNLGFSEVVNVTSLVTTAVTLQRAVDVSLLPNSYSLTLTSGVLASSVNGYEALFNISQQDLNQLKTNRIGLSSSSSWLVATSLLIRDMTGNSVNARTTALQARQFTGDSIAPQLLRFNLSMDSGLLTLSFSETVDRNSIDVTQITLQSNYSLQSATNSNDQSFTLRSLSSSVTTFDSPIMLVQISTDDLNEIKKRTNLATNTSNTFLSITNATIRDVFQIPVVPVSSPALRAATFTPDRTQPQLVSFQFDMNAETSENQVSVGTILLTLVFSETVKLSSFNARAITIQSTSSSGGAGSNYTLQGLGAEMVSTADDTVVIFKLNRSDANGIKLLRNNSAATTQSLATGQNTTYLSHTGALVSDMTGINAVVPTPSSAALRTSLYTADSTPPVLLSFDLDLNSTGTIVFKFDEIVDGSSLEPDQYRLQNTPVVMGPNITFTSGYGTSGGAWVGAVTRNTFVHANSATITMGFIKSDLEELKRIQVCMVSTSCFLAHSEWAVRDVAGNYIRGCV